MVYDFPSNPPCTVFLSLYGGGGAFYFGFGPPTKFSAGEHDTPSPLQTYLIEKISVSPEKLKLS